jgi:hypothetical protein
MKKFTLLMTIFAMTIFSNAIHAENTQRVGQAAKEGTVQAEKSFAWGICLGGLIVIGVIAGLAIGCSSTSPKVSH